MEGFNFDRSTCFVSLDTHPASNALVLTYDVLVTVEDVCTKQEIARASKRHQQIVQISILDKLGTQDIQTNNLSLDLNDLSEQIIRKSPLLSNERSLRKRSSPRIEDIKIHLLYLINRRQTQILAQRNIDTNSDDIPISSRFVSASRGRKRPGSSLEHSNQSQQISTDISESSDCDVYRWMLTRSKTTESEYSNQIKSQLKNHLEHLLMRLNLDSIDLKTKNIDSLLDDLYEEHEDRVRAIAHVAMLSCHNDKLSLITQNKLLICAFVRMLSESSQANNDLIFGEFLEISLINLSSFVDVYRSAFYDRPNMGPVDLIQPQLGALEGLIKLLILESQKQAKICSDDFYYLVGSHLIMLENLILLEKVKLLNTSSKKLYLSITAIAHLLHVQLEQDLKTLSKRERINRTTLLLNKLLGLMKMLSTEPKFITEVCGSGMKKTQNQRNQSQPLLDALISLINRLQSAISIFSQDDSGNQSDLVDRSIVNEFYSLELSIFDLVNNLMLDKKIRLQLIRKNVLKCVLRNIVSLIASHNNLNLFNLSPVLMIPLNCLYQISAHPSVKVDILRSKIILGCLFEYLINSASSLHKQLHKGFDGLDNSGQSFNIGSMSEIKLEPICADHYLLSIWCNLTSKPPNQFINFDENLTDLVSEYMELVNKIVILFSKIAGLNNDIRLLVYLHLKLFRNQSQSIIQKSNSNIGHVQIIDNLSNGLTNMMTRLDELGPLIVEGLYSICNLIKSNHQSNEKSSRIIDCSESLFKLMKRLFFIEKIHFENETEDDLILASCIYMSTFGRKLNICKTIREQNEPGFANIIGAAKFLLSTKSNDRIIIMSCLFAMLSLSDHVYVKKDLVNSTNNQLNGLVPKLSELMLNSDRDIAKVACFLSDRFLRLHPDLDDQATSLRDRFTTYNARWLAAIKSSRNELISTPDEETNDAWLDDDLEMLDDAAQIDILNDIKSPNGIYREVKSRRSQNGSLKGGQHDMNMNKFYTGEGDEEDDDDSEDDDLMSNTNSQWDKYDDASSLEGLAPDLEVIDSNSMIKHLTSRRNMRSKLLSS